MVEAYHLTVLEGIDFQAKCLHIATDICPLFFMVNNHEIAYLTALCSKAK